MLQHMNNHINGLIVNFPTFPFFKIFVHSVDVVEARWNNWIFYFNLSVIVFVFVMVYTIIALFFNDHIVCWSLI